MWDTINDAAQITAKIVIASAERLMDNLHFWRNNNKMAEISVPAWPIPTHQTKLVISHAQPTVLFNPHTPSPVPTVYETVITHQIKAADATLNAIHQYLLGFDSMGLQTSSVISCNVLSPRMSAGLSGYSTFDISLENFYLRI